MPAQAGTRPYGLITKLTKTTKTTTVLCDLYFLVTFVAESWQWH
jgi:hypothetical protein